MNQFFSRMILAGLAVCSIANAQTPKPAYTLTVLHNNDGESKLTAAGSGALAQFGGVSEFVSTVKRLKQEAVAGNRKRGVVTLSSGDNFLAGATFQASLDRGVPYYDSVALDQVGYDALCIGNHEFDFGPQVLANFISGFSVSRPKFLSANLLFGNEPSLLALQNQGRIAASHIVKANGGQLVGVVGATTPFLPAISSPGNVITLSNVAGAVQTEVDRLTARGVRIIILISHLQSVAEDRALAPLLRDVDIMIAGGGDDMLANPGTLLVPGDTIVGPYPSFAPNSTIPIITTAGDYKYVGKFVADFDARGNLINWNPQSGPVRVAKDTNPDPAITTPSDAAQPDAIVQSQVITPVSAYLATLAAQTVGTSNVSLEGRRGTGNANPALVVPGIRTTETNIGNLMADALLWQATQNAAAFGAPVPTIGFQNGGGIRNNSLIAPGNVTIQTTFDIAAFANFVSILPGVTPTELKGIMENAYSRVEFGDGRYLQISGFTVIYDQDLQGQISSTNSAGINTVTTPGNRVREIRLNSGQYIVQNGAIVPGAPSVNIASIDFTLRGGDQFQNFSNFITVGATYQQALRNYIQVGLAGSITGAQYPQNGNGRITRLN
jgi:5'-nucleotidase